jgi:hypothetical protein
MAKNTVPVTIWGVPVWKGGGRQKKLHFGTPRNHKVFVTIWGLTYMLIPKWKQTLFGNGDSPYGKFESPCPFPYGNHQMETVIPVWKTFPYGDFYLNPQMGMNSIRKRVSD